MDALANRALENRNSATLEHSIGVAELFRGIDVDEITRLARNAQVRDYARDEMVFQRGERPNGLLVVADGTLKLAVRGANGEHKVVALVEEGQACASALAFLDRPSALEATALTPATVISIPASAIFEAMQRDPELARRVVEHLSQRVLSLVDEVEGITLRRGLQRVAHYVESLARERGTNAHVVRLPSTKTLIAAQLGMAKETLSRLLHELVEKGAINVSRRDLFILDRATLSDLAEGRPSPNGNGKRGNGGADAAPQIAANP
jgi:CRP-like cAMP-binding protein